MRQIICVHCPVGRSRSLQWKTGSATEERKPLTVWKEYGHEEPQRKETRICSRSHQNTGESSTYFSVSNSTLRASLWKFRFWHKRSIAPPARPTACPAQPVCLMAEVSSPTDKMLIQDCPLKRYSSLWLTGQALNCIIRKHKLHIFLKEGRQWH